MATMASMGSEFEFLGEDSSMFDNAEDKDKRQWPTVNGHLRGLVDMGR